MKKLILLTLVLFSLISSHALACEQTSKTIATIDYVYYDTNAHMYYANTVPDAFGGFWTIDIMESDKKNRKKLKMLNKQYKGRNIEIVYIGSLENDSEIEIVSSEFIEE